MQNNKVKHLAELTVKSRNKFPYINLDKNNNYRGWVADFNLKYLADNSPVSLELHLESDLFLLFVLASAWSKSGVWENAAFFTAYLKQRNIDIKKWRDDDFVRAEMDKRKINCAEFINTVYGIKCRKRVSFRYDFYTSIKILADKWDEIKSIMAMANQKSDWLLFINYVSSIPGLGAKNNKMRIKTLLILRELKCQHVYPNIDGKYCCVADNRVRHAYKEYLQQDLPSNYLKASEIIWNDFGMLFDIPPFACMDLGLIQ